MKKLLFVLVVLLTTSTGCSSKENGEVNYHVIVVQGEENISATFGKYVSNPKYSIVEMEYLTNLEAAKRKYPDYDIENAPAFFIFETSVEMKKLKLKTYDIDEAKNYFETLNK